MSALKRRGWRAALLAAALPVALATSAARAGPPFLTDDPEPVELHHWEVYAFTQATGTAGDVSGAQPGVEVNYGAAPNLQIHLIAPVAFDQPDGAPRVFGYGDTEIGMKFRFIQEAKDGWTPQIGVFPLIELPTGDAQRGLGAGYTRIFLPLWAQKSQGDWTLYGGGGYWINPGPGNRDYWFSGLVVQRQIARPLALGAEVFHQTPDRVGGPATTAFNLGGVYDLSAHTHLLLSAGRGIQGAAQTNRFSYYGAIQWTF
jgi:hypothetical protein